jgi:diacylglycerol kinase (ATP)
MPPKRTIILNPFAKSEKAGPLWYELYKLNQQRKIRLTKGPGSATKKAAKAARKGYGVIVAAGGDGTINEVINGIVGTDAALGILPLGSVNVLARELRIPLKLKDAWKVIEDGHTRTLDLVHMEYEVEGKLHNRYFVQLAGFGLDAHIVKQVTWLQKKKWGPLSYVLETFKSVSDELPKIQVRIDDGEPVEAAFALAGNGRYYGGPIPVFSKASMTDGLVDMCLFQSGRRRDILNYLQAILRGAHTKTRGIIYQQAKSVEITSASPVPVEIDGEFVGHSPVRLKVVPSALKILVPASI